MTDRSTLIRRGEWLFRVRPAPLAVALKTLMRVKRVPMPTAEGTFWLDPASSQGLCLLKNDVYEPAMLETLKTYLRTGDTFADVGANEGYFSVIASRLVGPNGRVLAVEPQHRLQPVLRKNFELNQAENVTLVEAAVSDRPGNVQLHLTPGMNNSASSLMQPTRYPLWRQNTACATLEVLFNTASIAQCALLKLDIEGWEYEAVLGSRPLFESGRITAIALELHPHLLERRKLNGKEITDFLERCGYRLTNATHNLVYAKDAVAR